MKILLLIASGGAIGALLRHALVSITGHLTGDGIGLGTIVVNVLGSFLMGVIAALVLRHPSLEPTLRPLLMTGLLGALTTFSAFSLDVQRLWERELALASVFYIAGSVFFSLVALFIGMRLTNHFSNG